MKKSFYSSSPKHQPLSSSKRLPPSQLLIPSNLNFPLSRSRPRSTHPTSTPTNPVIPDTTDAKRQIIMKKLRDSLRLLRQDQRREQKLYSESMRELKQVEGMNERLRKNYRDVLKYVNRLNMERQKEREKLKRGNSICKREVSRVESREEEGGLNLDLRLVLGEEFEMDGDIDEREKEDGIFFSPSSSNIKKEIVKNFSNTRSIGLIDMAKLIESPAKLSDKKFSDNNEKEYQYSTEDIIPITVENTGKIGKDLFLLNSEDEEGEEEEINYKDKEREKENDQIIRHTSSIIIPTRYSQTKIQHR